MPKQSPDAETRILEGLGITLMLSNYSLFVLIAAILARYRFEFTV
ncbi:hypothetical protein SPWS13_0631 [Shewanella putrefaciens]|nr:hypothetical protein SPWS13_0631 [Shewanella putrefaciens]